MIDESNKKYGEWLVLSYAGSNSGTVSGSTWNCQCIKCGNIHIILGVNLRRNKLPICKNCCRKCGKTRNETKFNGNKTICINCSKQRIREWRDNNIHRKPEWKSSKPEKRQQYQKRAYIAIQSTPDRFLTYIYKLLKARINKSDRTTRRAIQQGKRQELQNINITPEYLHQLWLTQNGMCAISFMPMLYQFNNLCTVSIDRIDPSLGYVKTNVQLVCQWVNFAKNKFSNDDIIDILTRFKSLP